MDFLNIDTTSKETIKESFTKIAKTLFNDYQLHVNNNYYRLIDIEFYFFESKQKETDNHKQKIQDVYTHRHKLQTQSGKWYFHGSGIDLTYGNEKYYGGILIRSVAKLSIGSNLEIGGIEDVIYGPLNVKTEICSNFHNAFENNCNTFNLVSKKKYILSEEDEYIIPLMRNGLNPKIDINFFNENFRYLLILNDYKFKHKDIEKAVIGFISDKETKAEKISMDILKYNINKK